jgi:hypothetical protein
MQEDAVWDALARALTGEYEIVAGLGLGSGGAPVYLARELVTDSLVALRLPPLASGSDEREFGLEVVRQIDASLPDIDTRCPRCGTVLRRWTRFCTRCKRDISGIAPEPQGRTREQLRQLARETAAGKYDVIGDMPRAEGGGLVYFGRDLATDQIIGLQLEAGPDAGLVLTTTSFAAPDPRFQIPTARKASDDQRGRTPVGEITGRRVSVPRDKAHSSSASADSMLATSAVPRRNAVRLGLVGSAIIALIVLAFLVFRWM